MNRRAFLKSLGVVPLVPLVAVIPALREEPESTEGRVTVQRGARGVVIEGSTFERGGIVIEAGTDETRISDVLFR